MEHLKLCCVAPHPPIILPEIGGAEVRRTRSSIAALEQLGAEIRGISPETLVVMSPHTPIYGNAFSFIPGARLEGSFRQFGAPQVGIESSADEELAAAISEKAARKGIRVLEGGGVIAHRTGELDHGVLVPLYYLAPPSYMLTCIAISLLDYRSHYILGTAIREAVEDTGRRTVFVASGDLSHRLKPGAPAGYSPRGEEFDREIVEVMSSGDYGRLFAMDPALVDDAGECGLRSIFALAGTVDGFSVESEVLSYEGPFGVGYMVARVRPLGRDPQRELSPA